jgi:N-glycosylase/DNA lyase
MSDTRKTEQLTDTDDQYLKELLEIYSDIKPEITTRLLEFKQVWSQGADFDIYCELVFCLFTPQSKAKVCAEAIQMLREKNLVLTGTEELLGQMLNTVRFRYTKAKNLVESRKHFVKEDEVGIKEFIDSFDSPQKLRLWLVDNIRGMGFKEASHFLRNIGMGEQLAILDRHILKNLVLLGVLEELPKSMNAKKYQEIEQKLIKFSKNVNIPPDHLDLLLWYKETGEIFK